MKLWHDDVQRPPDDWAWARTNDDAKAILATGGVTEASLDHDLGLHGVDPEAYLGLPPDEAHQVFLAGRSEQTGYDLAVWMAETGHVPPRVSIHSFNPVGAQRMAAALAGLCHVTVQPFAGAR